MMGYTAVMLALLLPPILGKERLVFPKDFYVGAATSSYQVEGAWNVDGKGPSIWDTYTHKHPEAIEGGSNGDQAAKSYYLYKEDVAALKALKMNMYRFSISWPRIMPNGLPNEINQKGIDYYNKLIDQLIANGIEPMVTMYHWELPQHLQDLGGWANEALVDYFGDYVRVLYEHFGDRVKYWITINEPTTMLFGYMKTFGYHVAPDIDSPGIGLYLVVSNIIKAHARAYRIYDTEFRREQKGKISLSMNWLQYYPKNPNATEDVEAAKRASEFIVGLFVQPVYGFHGDYPELVKDIIARNSKKEGFPRSRLQLFTEKEMAYIRGTTDYFALNMYTSKLAVEGERGPIPSFPRDMAVIQSNKLNMPRSNTTSWLTTDPRSMYDCLKSLAERYGDWEIIITESGFSDDGQLEDDDRIVYLTTYMINVLRAMYYRNINVKGFLIWSLIDNFEWSHGYTAHFGLYQMNITDPKRKRIPKKSCDVVRNIIETREIPEQYYDIESKLYNSTVQEL